MAPTKTISSVLAIILAVGAVTIAPAGAQAPRLCQGEEATIIGTNGNDILRGTEGRDVIVGLGGHDRISGLGGNDLICGNAGNDRIWGGAGDDRIYGNLGHDRINGQQGADSLNGGWGNDLIRGGVGADTLFGSANNDRLYGGNGGDIIRGGNGADVIYGGNGHDNIYGDFGHDVIYGGWGNDEIDTGPGNDEVHDSDGFNIVDGESLFAASSSASIDPDTGERVITPSPAAAEIQRQTTTTTTAPAAPATTTAPVTTVAPATTAAPVTTQAPSTTLTENQFEAVVADELFRLVNCARTGSNDWCENGDQTGWNVTAAERSGLAAFQRSVTQDAGAKEWSEHLARTGQFCHAYVAPYGCGTSQVNEFQENVVAAFNPPNLTETSADETASLMFLSWMNSDGHRRTIFNSFSAATHVGLGAEVEGIRVFGILRVAGS